MTFVYHMPTQVSIPHNLASGVFILHARPVDRWPRVVWPFLADCVVLYPNAASTRKRVKNY